MSLRARVLGGVVWFLRDVRGLPIWDSDCGVVWQIQSGRWLASANGLYTDPSLVDRDAMETAARALMKVLEWG